jgi:hypothetical protein
MSGNKYGDETYGDVTYGDASSLYPLAPSGKKTIVKHVEWVAKEIPKPIKNKGRV